MNQADAVAALQALGRASASLRHRQTFFMTQGPTSDPVLSRLTLTQTLADSFDDLNKLNASNLANLVPIEYFGGRALPDGHIMWTPNSDVPLYDDIQLDSVDGKVVTPAFQPEQHLPRHLKLTITMAVGHDGQQGQIGATFFRITRPSAQLQRSGKLAAWLNRGSFDQLDNEVILFNRMVDAVSINGATFFTNVHNFTRTFRMVEKMQAEAAKTFDAILSGLQVTDMVGFRASATKDIPMMAKMASIQRKMDAHPTYREAMSMENLLRFVDATPSVDIELEGEGSERKFKFTPATRFKILKLLDDDFLTSNLTKFDYEVDSKSDPTGS